MRKRPLEQLSAAEFADLRAKLAVLGCTPAQIRSAIGDAPQGRMVGDIAESLRLWLKTRPKRGTAR